MPYSGNPTIEHLTDKLITYMDNIEKRSGNTADVQMLTEMWKTRAGNWYVILRIKDKLGDYKPFTRKLVFYEAGDRWKVPS